MLIHGIIRTAELRENPPGSESIEMLLKVQGVGAGQPRALVVPYALLLEDHTLGPDAVAGHGFEAEVEEEAAGRFVVRWIAVGDRRILREK
jgi:hypothetical protein